MIPCAYFSDFVVPNAVTVGPALAGGSSKSRLVCFIELRSMDNPDFLLILGRLYFLSFCLRVFLDLDLEAKLPVGQSLSKLSSLEFVVVCTTIGVAPSIGGEPTKGG